MAFASSWVKSKGPWRSTPPSTKPWWPCTRRPDGDDQLAAYIVGGERAPLPTELREYLRSRLPEYMIPASFALMDALPLTPNGKVNRKALSSPQAVRAELRGAFAAPQTPTEKRLAEIWSTVLKVKQVGVHDDFFDLGGHSLLAVRLFAQIEKAFGHRLPLATLLQGATINNLAKALQNTADLGYRTEIIPIQPKGSKIPLVFLPALVGEVMYASQVARHLGPDQPVFGIQLCCGDGKTKPLDNLEAIATQCVEDLCAFQPEGPYCLAGYSFAGMVAFEMAQQLLAKGRQVKLLAVIDVGPTEIGETVGPRRSALGVLVSFLRNLPHWFIHDFVKTGPRELLAQIRRKVRAVQSGRSTIFSFSTTTSQTIALEDLFDIKGGASSYRDMMEANLRAFSAYMPRPYPGRITLLRACTAPCSVRMIWIWAGAVGPRAVWRSGKFPATITASWTSRMSRNLPNS